LKQEEVSVADVVVSSIGSSHEFQEAQFVDTNHGWTGGSHLLYRTSNAGKDWQRLNPNIPPDSYITSFFFATSRHGWLTVVHLPQTEQYGTGSHSSIMVTNDSGDTWNEQAVFREAVSLNNVSFQTADRGFAVGDKLVKETQPYNEMFVVRTDDGGKTWRDVSEKVKPAIQTPFKIGNDSGRQVRWLSSSQIFLLTRRGRVIVSDNSGETWKPIVHFEDVRPWGWASSLGYYGLLFDTKGRLRILAGARGDEGYWGNLIVSDDRNNWHSYELTSVPLLDAMYLSESEVLACGQKLNRDEKTNTPLRPDGIILLSKDNGKSWSPIYRTGTDETLISLTRVNETDFYAVSDMGSFIKFRLK
jgi:photosystem II stability/assembly factor-like uncharacterized protein